MTPPIFIPNNDARKSLATKLNFAYHENMQDWEYEVSDINRISEYFSIYDLETTTVSEKESLMEIILDSINELISGEQSSDVNFYIQEVRKRFDASPDLHRATILYWRNNNFEISEYLKQ